MSAPHHGSKTIVLTEDCQAAAIPSGMPVLLTEGMEVTLVQHLGDSYTVEVSGQWVRVANDQAHALGEAYAGPVVLDLPEGASLEEVVWGWLKTCFDPEIPVNIVDLGLIYGCQVFPLEKEGQSRVHITMTLTAPGCGMGPILMEDIKRKLMAVDGVHDVVLEWVFDPPWTQDRMSDAAKLQLGML
jgi:probable FeS assembly SUF system protein SufT